MDDENAVIDAWRERMQEWDRFMAELRGGEGGHGHGGHGGHGQAQGQGGRQATFIHKPLDPRRTNDPVLNGILDLVSADDEVLDVGGGSGRYAIPLALRTKHVTVIEPSDDSVELLKERMAEFGIENITVVNEAWEDVPSPAADVALCSLVLHHVLDAAPFVRKMQQYAKERVVIVEMMETPGAIEMPFYERVHGAAPTPLPGLPKILELLWALEIYPDVTMVEPETAVLDTDRDGVLDHLRRRLSVEEGSEADHRLQAAANELLVDIPEGLSVRNAAMRRSAIVSWNPARA